MTSAAAPATPATTLTPGQTKGIEQVLGNVRKQLERMLDPNFTGERLTIERTGIGSDQAGVPRVVQFAIRMQHITAVAELPVANVTSLVLPQSLRGAPAVAPAVQAETPIEQPTAVETPVSTGEKLEAP